MRFLVWALVPVLLIYSWIEIAQSDPRQVRQFSRGLWAVIVLFPLFGPVAWLIAGRPNGDDVKRAAPKPRPRVVAPDDDPDFLRSLKLPPKPPTDEGDQFRR